MPFSTLAVLALYVFPPSFLVYYYLTRKPPTSAEWVAKAERHDPFRPTHMFHLPGTRRLLAYNEYGNDQNATRTVLFIHGSPGCRLPPVPDFEAACAAANCKVVIVDRPGFGLSTADPAGTPSSFADDLDFFLREMHGDIRRGSPIEREQYRKGLRTLADYSVEVAGFSMGAPYAIAYATKYPQRVDKLMLLSPAGLYDPTEDDAADKLGWPIRLCHWLVANKKVHILKGIWKLLASSIVNPDSYLFRLYVSRIRAPNAVSFDQSRLQDLWTRRIAESTRQGIEAPMRDTIVAFGTIQGEEEKKWGVKAGPLACPLAVVHGSKDEFVTRPQAKRLYHVVAGERAEFIDLEGATHFGVLDAAYWMSGEEVPEGKRSVRLMLRRGK